LNQITPLVLTRNEAPNIERTLARLSWARDIVVVDSLSDDDTPALARRRPGVRVFERPFTTHEEQWNFGLAQTGIATEWVLALDADFVLSAELIEELRGLTPPDDVAGYQASFTYCIDGKPLKSAVYPAVTVLYRRAQARYVQDGHTQRVHVAGRVVPLMSRIFHDDRKPLRHWLASQKRYMRLEADKLVTTPVSALPLVDRARKMIVIAPPAMLAYCLFVRGGLFDGWPGVYYALQRATAELILSMTLVRRLVGGKA
jgi:glycosyltransferase involved in cell wall biosynthesis